MDRLRNTGHEIVCQLKPLVYSLDLNNAPRICFVLLKLRFKCSRLFKQEISRCKIAGAGFHSTAKTRALIPRFATTIISSWQIAFKCTADCQPPLSCLIWTMRTVQACGNPLSNWASWLYQSAVRQFSLLQSSEYTPRSAIAALQIGARD
jgi:hypothetical protein